MHIREPAVAGMFYPADQNQLRQFVEDLLDQAAGAPAGAGETAPKALIVPHAGYIYSGAVAASAYHLLAPWRQAIHRVVLLGPAHRVYLEGMAIPGARQFRTPLGTIALDAGALEKISTLAGVVVSDAAHADEHCLEVQLPFLQLLLDEFTLVPIVVGRCDADPAAMVIDTLWGGAETLIVISSDLSHYLPYQQAQYLDHQTGRRILGKASDLSGNEACGANAINALMRAAHTRALEIENVDLRNSGDTAGDKSRVVGYGAFVAH